MPQTTNRFLVGEMSATPTGPGTVYSSVLKACATNRERAARVNNSERQRLQRATKVIDKHSRHNQWTLDQQMEQVRRSLIKLDAFQKVLRDDYPTVKLLGKIYCQRKQRDLEQKQSHRGVQNNGNDAESMKKTTTTSSSENHEVDLVESSEKCGDNETLGEEFNTESIDSQSFDIQRHRDQFVPASKSSKNAPTSHEDVIDKQECRSQDEIDAVTTANSLIQHSPKQPGACRLTVLSGSDQSQHKKSRASFLSQILNSDDTIPEVAENKSMTTTENGKKQLQLTETKKTQIQSYTIDNKLNKDNSKKQSPNDIIHYSNTKQTPRPRNYTNDAKCVIVDTDLIDQHYQQPQHQMSVEQQKRHELKEKRRKDRQAKKESLISCNRGFDVHTLRGDIERKIRRMDIGRQHRRFMRHLLAESTMDNNRILQANKVKFDSIMTKPPCTD